MRKILVSALSSLGITVALVQSAYAHFTYVVPSADGSKIQVIFSDSLEADKKVPIDKIAKTTLFCVDAAGKHAPLSWTKSSHALLAEVPGKDVRIIAGYSDYGFHQSKHTQNIPVWLKYYPKVILGNMKDAENLPLGNTIPLEIIPVVNNGQLSFQARLKGKPLAQAEFGVLVPGQAEGLKMTADATGLTKTQFDKPGKYGVRAAYIEKASGELDGNKYEEIRHYATLVVDFAPPVR